MLEMHRPRYVPSLEPAGDDRIDVVEVRVVAR
jgi:hypothetical protein